MGVSVTNQCRKYHNLKSLGVPDSLISMTNSNHEATALFKMGGGNESGQHERLRRVICKLNGVLEVRVNYILDTISVKYDSDALTRDEIKKKVDRSNNSAE